jgi:hypothetical protein
MREQTGPEHPPAFPWHPTTRRLRWLWRAGVVGAMGEAVPTAPQTPGARRYVISGMMSSATMFATLIIGLIAGPAVSL